MPRCRQCSVWRAAARHSGQHKAAGVPARRCGSRMLRMPCRVGWGPRPRLLSGPSDILILQGHRRCWSALRRMQHAFPGGCWCVCSDCIGSSSPYGHSGRTFADTCLCVCGLCNHAARKLMVWRRTHQRLSQLMQQRRQTVVLQAQALLPVSSSWIQPPAGQMHRRPLLHPPA